MNYKSQSSNEKFKSTNFNFTSILGDDRCPIIFRCQSKARQAVKEAWSNQLVGYVDPINWLAMLSPNGCII